MVVAVMLGIAEAVAAAAAVAAGGQCGQGEWVCCFETNCDPVEN